MRKIILSLIACFLVGLGTLNASFPVKKASNSDVVEMSSQNEANSAEEALTTISSAQELMQEGVENQEIAEKANKFSEEDWITLALWFFLGGFAAHRWYKGKPAGWNILYILTLGGCGVWAIVDLINILKKDF